MLHFWAQIAKISNRRKYPLYGIYKLEFAFSITIFLSEELSNK